MTECEPDVTNAWDMRELEKRALAYGNHTFYETLLRQCFNDLGDLEKLEKVDLDLKLHVKIMRDSVIDEFGDRKFTKGYSVLTYFFISNVEILSKALKQETITITLPTRFFEQWNEEK